MKTKKSRGIYGVITGLVFFTLGLLEIINTHKINSGLYNVLGVATLIAGLFIFIVGLVTLTKLAGDK